MCTSEVSIYACGCPSSIPTITKRCVSCRRGSVCSGTTFSFTHLQSNCEVSCYGSLSDSEESINLAFEKDRKDNYMYSGSFLGMTSQQDKFLGRSQSPIGARSLSPVRMARFKRVRREGYGRGGNEKIVEGAGESDDEENATETMTVEAGTVSDEDEKGRVVGPKFESRSKWISRRRE